MSRLAQAVRWVARKILDPIVTITAFFFGAIGGAGAIVVGVMVVVIPGPPTPWWAGRAVGQGLFCLLVAVVAYIHGRDRWYFGGPR